ncbi:MAG: TRL-like family protein, partial [Kiritimatiellae bacterium]|nr:TRL-like family protein [Kiritimatiellia bacterium]
MRKALVFFCLGIISLVIVGCATPYPIGSAYTELKLPVGVTDNAGTPKKVGTAMCQSILGLVAIGDASIDAAKKQGGITKVHHVDWDAKNILGLYGVYKVTV